MSEYDECLVVTGCCCCCYCCVAGTGCAVNTVPWFWLSVFFSSVQFFAGCRSLTDCSISTYYTLHDDRSSSSSSSVTSCALITHTHSHKQNTFDLYTQICYTCLWLCFASVMIDIIYRVLCWWILCEKSASPLGVARSLPFTIFILFGSILAVDDYISGLDWVGDLTLILLIHLCSVCVLVTLV